MNITRDVFLGIENTVECLRYGIVSGEQPVKISTPKLTMTIKKTKAKKIFERCDFSALTRKPNSINVPVKLAVNQTV